MVLDLCVLLLLGMVTSDQQTARIERLESALLAPCCYREPLSRHQSEIAVKMRMEIRHSVEAGKSDAEILAAYKGRYGAQVLAPPLESRWWSTAIPWLLTLLGAAGLGWLLARRFSRTAGPPPADTDALPPVPESEEEWSRIEPISQK